ncbi:MAG: hypothetical protein QOK36_4329, partial [Gaiellales bacterium]|nr:hypothetical protein [Gaiellales bacterium]
MHVRRRTLTAVLAAALAAAAGTLGVTVASSTPASTMTPVGAASSPSGSAPTVVSGAVDKVLVFVEENHSLDQMRAGMPYLYSQAQQYGYATS